MKFNFKTSGIFELKRIMFYGVILLLLVPSIIYSYKDYDKNQKITSQKELEILELQKQQKLIGEYTQLLEMISIANEKYPELDLNQEKTELLSLKNRITTDWAAVDISSEELAKIRKTVEDKVAAKEADEKTKGEITGTVSYNNSPQEGVTIKIIQDNTEKASILSLADGTYYFKNYGGKYTITAELSGFENYSAEIEITALSKATHDISLQKIVVTPKRAVSTSAATSTDEGNYSKKSITTNLGTFTVHLMSFDLSQYGMKIDTASDGDCTNDCPVKTLKDYVSLNGGVAGIHGTYFCPTSYSTCAGKTNSFYYKLYNSRVQQKINWDNGLGDYLPFLMITKGGEARYYSTWDAAKNLEMYAGISCRPKLVENGAVVLQASDLDSAKESTDKISHGFIGLKGQTVYVGIVLSATMFDSAAVTQSLGLDYAFNIDGGGTSAMYYNGSYKVGPGRSMPNAIVFYKK